MEQVAARVVRGMQVEAAEETADLEVGRGRAGVPAAAAEERDAASAVAAKVAAARAVAQGAAAATAEEEAAKASPQ